MSSNFEFIRHDKVKIEFTFNTLLLLLLSMIVQTLNNKRLRKKPYKLQLIYCQLFIF